MKTSVRSPRLPHRRAGVRHREPRRRPEVRRRAEDPAHGLAAQRLDPRGGDGVRRGAVHVALQQPRDVRPARGQEQPRLGRARPRHQVGVDGRQHQAGLHRARGREVARRQAVQRQGRRLHLRPAAGRRGREQAAGAIRARRGGPTSRRSPPTATPRPRSISRRRSPRCWRCSPRATRRSIPATCRPTRCGAGRSAPARSSSPSSR